MEYEIASMLMNNNIEGLCLNYNLYNFQAQMLCFMYSNTKRDGLRNSIINGIQVGKYTADDEVFNMFKTFIDKAIRGSKDIVFSILIERCNLGEEDARQFIESYTKANRNLDEMLSAELDVSNINIRMNDMLHVLLPAFLESENMKKL